MLSGLWQDLRYGLCSLRRNSVFNAVATLSLALGIGANTAILAQLEGKGQGFIPIRTLGRMRQSQPATFTIQSAAGINNS
jgi:hypothetical protein